MLIRDVFFVVLHLVFAFSSFFGEASERIQVYTLPKSGTYLISSVLQLLEEVHPEYELKHLTDTCGVPFTMSGKRAVNIRDLRDYFVSLRHFTNKVIKLGEQVGESWPGFKSLSQYQIWKAMTDDEQLMALITLQDCIPYLKFNIINNTKVADDQVCQAFSDPNFLITRFESWIGENGGGSKLCFTEQLTSFLNHFGFSISSHELEKVYANFYGNSLTFDVGKIGRWQDEFKEEHVIAFKNMWNQYLIHWGYEIDENW